MATPSSVLFRAPRSLELRRVKPFIPGWGLFLSLLLHALVVAGFVLAGFIQPDPPLLHFSAADFALLVEIPVTPESPALPALPSMESKSAPDAPSPVRPRPRSPFAPRLMNRPALSAGLRAQHPRPQPKPEPLAVYSGPQRIVSNVSDATNTVQTIRRPDLVQPPKLKFPVRLPSMVLAPAPPPVLPSLAPQPPATDLASTALPTVEKPAIPVSTATVVRNPQADKAAITPPSAIVPGDLRPEKSPLPMVNPTFTGPKTAIVVNAIAVPPQQTPTVPDAEISGRFAVVPTEAGGDLTAGSGPEHPGNAYKGDLRGTQKGSGPYANSSEGNPGGRGRHGNDSNGSNSAGGVTGPGGIGRGGANHTAGGGGTAQTGSGTGAGNGPSGISISGGIPGRNTAPSQPARPGSYGITIISSGSNGGAMRDMGVFRRDELVYTVYMSMSDVGGGSAWPMQYSLISGSGPGNGLLVPPFPATKVAAVLPSSQRDSSQCVFIAGILSNTGELHDLRPVRYDSRSDSAIDTLKLWHFSPAQLDGHPVDVKVLIGVYFAAHKALQGEPALAPNPTPSH